MYIRMLRTIRPSYPRLADPDTELIEGRSYEAFRDHLGQLCGIGENGRALPVRDGEFEWIFDRENHREGE